MAWMPANVSGDLVRVALMKSPPGGADHPAAGDHDRDELVPDPVRNPVPAGRPRGAEPPSGKAAETVSRDTRGFDGAKLINGRKRHLIVDTKGLLMTVKVTPADVTDRDAARELLPELRERNPELTSMWADNAYTGLARPRNSRDHERLPENSQAHITWADITLMTRRRAKKQQAMPPGLLAASIDLTDAATVDDRADAVGYGDGMGCFACMQIRSAA